MANKLANVRKSPPGVVCSQTLDDGDTMDIKVAEQPNLEAFEVQSVNHENSSDLELHIDNDGDGNFERTVVIAEYRGEGSDQSIVIQIIEGMMLRIVDTSNDTDNDYSVTGTIL